MKNKAVNNAKVGLLVLAGIIFLILTLYMIGKNRNLLGATFTIKAVISNVNGLVPGNNVRFKGIDVGTVKSIGIANDTAIFVVMTIDQKIRPYIKKNAIVTIGTDGLMGNKLININSTEPLAPPIEEDDVLQSRKPIETDEMLRTLNTTNNNIERITNNLYEISVKLNSSESLWTLLSDTVIAKDIKKAIVHLKNAGANTAELTSTAKHIVGTLDDGDGIVYQLFQDTTLSNQLAHSLQQLQDAGNQTSAMMTELKHVIDNVKQGDGTAGLVLTDTLLREKLFKSAVNIEQGTDRFNQNMEALKSNFLFRRYFKKLEKQQLKDAKSSKN
jgi:phospholipid/cholesterol/gamma-HCH transport system substrate-binding protein